MTDHWSDAADHVEVTVRQDVAVVTLRRPDKLNALTAAMRRTLAATFRRFADGALVRGVVVTGTGRAFSAGEDLNEAAGNPSGGLVAEVELFQDITRAALETRVPVVAALNGIAVGGAAEMTLCFDARIGTPATEFYLPENATGLSISNAASVLLPRLVGGSRAMRLVMESARIDAPTALSLGLLDEIVEPPSLVETAVDLIRRWTQPGSAYAAHLALLRPSLHVVEQAMAAENEAAQQVELSGIAHAGINRFLASRPTAGS